MNFRIAASLLVVSLPLAAPFATPSGSSVRTQTLPQITPLSLPSQSAVSTIATPQACNNKPHVLYMTSDAAAASSEAEDTGGDATVTQLIFNLVKGIVGAGVLSLPAGIAAFSDAPGGVVPAVSLIAIIGGLSAYGFALIGRCCAYTNTKSYRDAWSATVSQSSSWLPATAVTFKTVAACLAYSMILGDTFVSLLSTVGVASSKIPVTLGLTGTVLLPLCLMKNLSSLAPFSLVGSLGMMYTALAMVTRYLGKAYTATGPFGADNVAALRPKFGTVGAKGALTPSAAILVSMLSTAFMAHFNAPKFYNELKDKTLPKYYKVVSTSFAISISIFALVASIGFLTFGSNASGLILNNYSTRDGLMNLSRIAVAVSLVFSYPLAFVGARDGVLDLLKMEGTDKTQNVLTVALLAIITGAALVIPDVSFVMALAGATLGNGLIYIFPALMFRGAIKKKKDATKGEKREVKLAMGSAVAGLIMGLIGTKMAIGSL
mmetsp:Transcript_92813/g.189058  ORF Transcript_92813/g.189058 Transcript_92813/m.189058 type:complete len:490 (+) Transcript_92813:165-1634(+)|eukprot:CAMPEP_0201163938 /NCGR_PEP_ID=MMETSP0851-20130426/58768_1 /ASSEMBLY_ACC=CAM_ASM_000631 /TAXON_ID=183588 /ORGANISM="Pseudo-nitzschia fraudulenta, Strain WWA7" /LENGTH=489 /DNA_ID=CAMNT_0047444241 /DNA_START=139 /DNA_END=1608 /DNA_ORIENTATION=-